VERCWGRSWLASYSTGDDMLCVLAKKVGHNVLVYIDHHLCACNCQYMMKPYCYRWRLNRLLSRLRRPVGEDKVGTEEEMREADQWSVSNSDTSDVPLLAASSSSSSSDGEDITQLERLPPLGAEET